MLAIQANQLAGREKFRICTSRILLIIFVINVCDNMIAIPFGIADLPN